MKAAPVFVTGTDTGVGKTFVGAGLLAAARARGLKVAGYKPVASGCEPDADGALRNEDALALASAAGGGFDYASINPYAFAPPLAPHIAARRVGAVIETAGLDRAFDQLAAQHDWVLVEGAGGWQVPLNDQQTWADWVQARGWPVLLVVGLRLGCLNHALLTAESVQRRGLRLVGWVANELPPGQEAAAENIQTLEDRLQAPLLGTLAPGARADADSVPIFERLWPLLVS